jgi:hypothetical protein
LDPATYAQALTAFLFQFAFKIIHYESKAKRSAR